MSTHKAEELIDDFKNEIFKNGHSITSYHTTKLIEASAMLSSIPRLEAEVEGLKGVLKEIIAISDRKHDAWDKAKELLNGHNSYREIEMIDQQSFTNFFIALIICGMLLGFALCGIGYSLWVLFHHLAFI